MKYHHTLVESEADRAKNKKLVQSIARTLAKWLNDSDTNLGPMVSHVIYINNFYGPLAADIMAVGIPYELWPQYNAVAEFTNSKKLSQDMDLALLEMLYSSHRWP